MRVVVYGLQFVYVKRICKTEHRRSKEMLLSTSFGRLHALRESKDSVRSMVSFILFSKFGM